MGHFSCLPLCCGWYLPLFWGPCACSTFLTPPPPGRSLKRLLFFQGASAFSVEHWLCKVILKKCGPISSMFSGS